MLELLNCPEIIIFKILGGIFAVALFVCALLILNEW